MSETIARPGPRRFDLLVLGEVNLDLVLRGGVEPVFGQQERLVDSADLVLGGAGAIMACGAARLGLSVAFCGLAGDDAIGRLALDLIAGAGVDVSAVGIRPGERSGIGVGLVRGDNDRAILTYGGLIPRFSVTDIPAGTLERARHVHVGAYFLQTGLHAGLAAAFAEHRRRGGTTSLDPNWDPAGAWALGELPGTVDVLLPNAREATLLTGCADVEAAAARLAARGAAVAIKLGLRGALWHEAGHTTWAPAIPAAHVVDATGAGDSFDAGVVAGLLDGAAPADLLALGNACGALSLQGVGGTAAQPTRAEALAAIGQTSPTTKG
jgi:sugar/nucleoside kinase (ribokinase family)